MTERPDQLHIVTASLETAAIGASCLRQKAIDVPADVSAALLRHVIAQMLFCLYHAGGVGLAAPQVGINWRLVLAMERGSEQPPLVLINPRLLDCSDETADGREGCLSLPGYVSQKVPRSTLIKIEALNQHLLPVQIEARDFVARVIQHEYDHLDGILYIDRLRTLADLERQDAAVRAANAADQLFTMEAPPL